MLDTLTQLQTLTADHDDTPPADCLTREAWAKRWRLSESHTRAKLREAVVSGAMVCEKYKIQHGQVRRMVPHYREA